MNIMIVIVHGFLAGWLVNYLSDVLPTLRKLSRPTCIHCGTAFGWRDYFLVSACRTCKKPRSWRTYSVLVLGPVIAVLLSINPPAQFPAQFSYWISLLVLTYFGVVLVIDLEHRLILHIVSIVGAVIGLLAGIAANGLLPTLVGGLGGLLIMLAFYFFGTLFARYRARKRGRDDGEEALGFGDVTLSAVIGLMLGWPLVITALIIAVLAGGIISVLMIIILVATRRFESMNVFIAYGPYLVLGATLLMFFPQAVGFLTGK
jgi:prepilin signal peptidase PulO-like enzyme (type II secretory pathway)